MAGRVAYYGGIVRDGLVLDLDAAKRDSYPKTGTVWSDISLSTNIGIFNGGVTYSSDNGGTLIFNGNNAFVNISPAINLNLGTNDFTISVWLYLFGLPSGEVYPNSYWIFGTGPVNSTTSTQCFIGASKFHFDLNTSYQGPFSASTADVNHGLAINNWYNIAVSRIGITFSVYVNGVVIGTGSSAQSAVNNYDWAICKPEPLPSTQTGYFYGKMQNFLVYNGKGLNSSEVLQNYNAVKGRFRL